MNLKKGRQLKQSMNKKDDDKTPKIEKCNK